LTEHASSGGAGFAGAGAGPDWLELCRACVDDVRGVLVELPTRAEREPVVGQGLGGDETTAVDEAAERAILARFRELDGVTLISEEVGRLGDGGTVVVIDPIDGSLNAKRGIPFFSVSIAVADGKRMGDVHFGYVFDFGSGEEWIARRGDLPTLNGEPLVVRPKERIEILAFEATRTPLVARDAPKVAELAYRLRIMGSLALSLCHLAAGRVDAVCSLKAARSVDIAAAQLLVREAGLAIELFDDTRTFEEAELDLEGRSRVAAAGTAELCRAVADALSA
jgi:myo-inositol-1(or 4)-monophosphatase